jgi:hypothetical protein
VIEQTSRHIISASESEKVLTNLTKSGYFTKNQQYYQLKRCAFEILTKLCEIRYDSEGRMGVHVVLECMGYTFHRHRYHALLPNSQGSSSPAGSGSVNGVLVSQESSSSRQMRQRSLFSTTSFSEMLDMTLSDVCYKCIGKNFIMEEMELAMKEALPFWNGSHQLANAVYERLAEKTFVWETVKPAKPKKFAESVVSSYVVREILLVSVCFVSIEHVRGASLCLFMR